MGPEDTVRPAVRKRLVFVRHGEAEGVHGRCVGHFDAPLSVRGIAGAQALVWDDIGVDAIVSSDLRRAIQTAAIIADATTVSYAIDPRLREMNFGEWDGRSWAELEACDGQRLSTWMEHWITASAPNGETVGELSARVNQWLNEMIRLSPSRAPRMKQFANGERTSRDTSNSVLTNHDHTNHDHTNHDHTNHDHTTVVVAHAGSIRAALCALRGIPLARMFDIPVQHTTMISVELPVGIRAPRQASWDQLV